MTYLRILLLDTNPKLVAEWNRQLKQVPNHTKLMIETFNGSLSEISNRNSIKSAILSPANSIGGMGGGFDKVLCDLFSVDKDCRAVESWIRRYLRHGYTPLGTSHLVEFDDFPGFINSTARKCLNASCIIVTPTMRVPQRIYQDDFGDSFQKEQKRNVVRFIFDCVWESLCSVARYNEKIDLQCETREEKIDTIIMPGLGTGFGGLPLDLAAKGMIGALSLWGISKPVDVGLLCLIFLGEDYNAFNNPDIVEAKNCLIDGESYDVLQQDVGDFYKIVNIR
ncbi:hypothetical protein CANINC_000245 [Pichia inconspicua]|uniref:Macro domain-containing protein n=1 Tax=Pichia inconspicua TaxID=52247 RepID=A0A4T0X6P0_9ASCO|nr:hypothetical protein CANINC_000245 [[Candida] inconspicua]